MRKLLICLLLLVATIARAQEKASGSVDPETIKAAMERLNQKRRAATAPASTQPATSRPATTPSTTGAATPASTQAAERPRRVVFVIDATGSMMTHIDGVRLQIRAGLQELAARDYFNIVVELEESAVPFAKAMVLASPANVEAAAKWIMALQVHGGGSFEHALAAGLKLHPDLIWLVSDADVAAPLDTLKATRKANSAHIPINTVLHFTQDMGMRVIEPAATPKSKPAIASTASPAQQLLWQIAEDSGGICLDRDGKRIVQSPGTPLEPKPASAPKPAALPPVKGPSIFQEK